jgi:hypothetical protein
VSFGTLRTHAGASDVADGVPDLVPIGNEMNRRGVARGEADGARAPEPRGSEHDEHLRIFGEESLRRIEVAGAYELLTLLEQLSEFGREFDAGRIGGTLSAAASTLQIWA